MKIMVFLHGTALMHPIGMGRTREERVRHVLDGDAVAERVLPDVLIECDCESIGGVDDLPDNILKLLN